MENVSIYPSPSGWITPRATGIELTTDNMLIITAKPIADLRKVRLRTANTVKIYVNLSDDTSGNITIDDIATAPNDDSTKLKALDITKYFVEKARYDTLSVRSPLETATADNTKNNSSYYTRNDTEIKLCTQKANAFSEEPLLQAVYWTLKTMLTQQKLYNGSREILSFGTSVEAVSSMLSWQYRVEYIALGESAKIEVPKTNPLSNEFVTPYSQQQQIVSSVGLGRNMQAVSNRTGVETRQIVRVVQSMGKVRKVGSTYKSGGETWRLTEVGCTCVPGRIICKETWAKNWGVRSEFVGINREFRSWNIPSDIVQRNLLYQDYLYITKDTISLLDNAIISTEARKEIAQYLKMSGVTSWADKTEITNFAIQKMTATADDMGVIISCTAFGFGNSLVFSGKTKDNLSAGIRRKQLKDGDTVWQQCVDSYYCNADGTLVALKVQGASDIANNNPDVYPEYTATVNVQSGKMLFGGVITMDVDKDASEQLNFTYQLHMLTNDSDLIIGTAWAARNRLVHQYDEAPTQKWWALTKPLPQGAQTMTTEYGATLAANGITIDTTGDVITFTFPAGSGSVVGYCLTDSDNNIIVAHNSSAAATYNMRYTHNYEDIKKAIVTGG